MPAIESTAKPRSKEARANAAAMQELVNDLHQKVRIVENGGGPGPRVDGDQGREAPAALTEAVGQIQVADHRRTRLRAALEDRRRTTFQGVQPTL